MKRMIDCAGQQLRWEQPHALCARYDLRDAAQPVAWLRLHGRAGALAEAESADGAWRFMRSGRLHPVVVVRACADDTELGRVVVSHLPWRNAGLILPGGRRLQVCSNFWQTRLSLRTEGGTDLITYERRMTLKMSGRVRILAAAAMPELHWLLCLGWYLAVAMEAESGFAS